MSDLPAHSLLGASGAERWMNCPGSVTLLKALQLDESDEPEYRTLGVAAHDLAAKALRGNLEAWELVNEIGEGGVVCDPPMSEAIGMYLNVVRPMMVEGNQWVVEEKMHRPDLHKLYFGTADFACYVPSEELLDVTDYKHGEGIVVDVEWNPQLMYYAYGLLARFPGVRHLRLRIVQPRAFHPDGPIRTWEVDAEAVAHWAETELIPKMQVVELESDLDPGPWCRFCPAKLVCPVLTALFEAAAKADPKQVVVLSNDSLGRSYQYVKAVEFYLKAMKLETHKRLDRGQSVAGTKLVAMKANRVFKAGAAEVLTARLGDAAYTPSVLKSPAEIEKLGADAAGLVKEWAFTPATGTTVALASDKKPGIVVTPVSQVFAAAVEALNDDVS